MYSRFSDLVVAEGVSIDQLTGRVTAFNLLDFIYTQGTPAAMPRIAIVAMYALGESGETFEERVRLVRPDGEGVAASESVVQVDGRESGQAPCLHRSIHIIWTAVLPVLGDYSVTLERRLVDASVWILEAQRTVAVLGRPHPLFPRVSVPPSKT